LFCNILLTKGPIWFYNVLKNEFNITELRDKYVDICDICNYILDNNKYVKLLKEHLSKNKLSSEL